MDWLAQAQQSIIDTYKMDYGWLYTKDDIKNLVAENLLTAEEYQQIVGEAYVAPQPQAPTQG